MTTLYNQISDIVRGQHQIMHQLDNLNKLLRGNLGESSHQIKTKKKGAVTYSDSTGPQVMMGLAVGCLGIFFMKGLLAKN